MSVTYTKEQKAAAADGRKLATVAVDGVMFQGLISDDDWETIVTLAMRLLKQQRTEAAAKNGDGKKE